MACKIKICGITRFEDAKAALELGADLLGFNFYAKSPRYVHPKIARGIIEKLRRRQGMAGVFVNSPAAEVSQIALEAGLDTLQFHGDENEGYLRQFPDYVLIKAVRVQGDFEAKELRRLAQHVDYLLFDSFSPQQFGGTGREISEALLAELDREGLLNGSFLSGGLTVQNVAERVKAWHLGGVDTASGVESKPGIKDKEKMRAFIAAARSAK